MFRNLRLLKEDMLRKGVTVESFYFYYQEQWYIVLAEFTDQGEGVAEQQLAQFTFLREVDFTDTFTAHVSDGNLFMDIKSWKEYFDTGKDGIADKEIHLFTQVLSEVIPCEVNKRKTTAQKEAVNLPKDKMRVY
ncbi:hypothetical protein M2145_001069 [Lachnospiraceae bacterium PF1-21]|uniref:DUF6037 family protein n=1 Tax=Ohessyouella blattaphilus TaxID=2949333 RepID=A0ABT1EQC5_9FIRM|nr:DUF6037 family protein [Ohessyouella blattaphilus]MCP1111482.1 DUF6037 family protein [Ohessyouella blattaphilus]MCR8564876.1 DUF6037 family protein [Ohessyouella blattaphilus]